MIVINKAAANTVVLTLAEKTTLSPVNYLFEFYDETSKVSHYFIAADTSSYVYRYNQFVITEKASPNPLAGEVQMSRDGLWSYIIREQASSTNLDPALSGAVVERGKIKVLGTAETEYTYTPTTDTKPVYNG